MHFERSMMNLWLPEKHLRFARLPPGKNPQIQPNCSMHLMGTKSAHNREEIFNFLNTNFVPEFKLYKLKR